MKIRFSIVLIIGLFTLCFNLHAQDSKSFDLFKPLNGDSAIYDLEVLEKILLEVHPGINQHTSPERIGYIIDSISQKLMGDPSSVEFHNVVSFILAQMKDAHTFVHWEEAFRGIEGNKRMIFPLWVTELKGSYYIKDAVRDSDRKYKGYELISINGRKIQDITNKVYHYSSFEGSNISARGTKLQDFPTKYFLLEDTSKTFELEIINPKGRLKKIRLEGISASAYDGLIYKTQPPVEYILESNVAILTIHSFISSSYKNANIDYEKYFTDFFNLLSQKSIDKLIIDLRGNEGGSSEVSNELFSWLYPKDYYYFEYQAVSFNQVGSWAKYLTGPFQPWLDSLKTRSENGLYCYTEQDDPNGETMMRKFTGKQVTYVGKTIALIDGACFSTTGHFIALLKHYRVAQLLGECSHGSYYSNDGGTYFKLPYSGLVVRIPVAQSKMRLPGFVYDSKGICPDITLEANPKDLKTGFDSQLSKAIKLLKLNR